MKTHILLSAMLCGACSHGPGPVVPKTPVERQMIGLLEKFDRWDHNGDGELSEAELNAGLKDRGTSYTGRQVIDFYDTSGNGTISLREAQAGYRRANEVPGRLQR